MLWVGVEDVVVLLGSDLEKRGWIEILQSEERPTSKASVFKVPHHGSESAHEPDAWKRMLNPDPFAVLAPWQRGGRILPTQCDVQRILSHTKNAYATAKAGPAAQSPRHANRAVARTMSESSTRFRRLTISPGAIRLRRPIHSTARWKVETFGSACHLKDLVGS